MPRQFSRCNFVAQFIEAPKYYLEGTGSNPSEALISSGLFLSISKIAVHLRVAFLFLNLTIVYQTPLIILLAAFFSWPTLSPFSREYRLLLKMIYSLRSFEIVLAIKDALI